MNAAIKWVLCFSFIAMVASGCAHEDSVYVLCVRAKHQNEFLNGQIAYLDFTYKRPGSDDTFSLKNVAVELKGDTYACSDPVNAPMYGEPEILSVHAKANGMETREFNVFGQTCKMSGGIEYDQTCQVNVDIDFSAGQGS